VGGVREEDVNVYVEVYKKGPPSNLKEEAGVGVSVFRGKGDKRGHQQMPGGWAHKQSDQLNYRSYGLRITCCQEVAEKRECRNKRKRDDKGNCGNSSGH